MDIAKIKKLASEMYERNDEYNAAIIVRELDSYDLEDADIEVAIDRILDVYYNYDYATLQGIAIAYGNWFSYAQDTNDVEDWIGSYEMGDWR